MTSVYQTDQDRLSRADQLGLAMVRTLVLLNGGAIISVMTFLGNASSQTKVTIETIAITWSILAFLVSIVSVIFALGVSYTFYAIPTHSKYSLFWNNWIVLFNAILVLFSTGAFVVGVVFLLNGVIEVR